MKGSIRKRTGKRGVSYLVRVDLGVDPVTGKRRQPSKSFRTRKEAERELARWINEIEKGTAVDGSRITVGEYLQQWLRDYAQHNVRPSTYRSYEQMIRIHLIPGLGGIALQKLHPSQLQSFYSSKLSGGRADGKEGGLSPHTVRYLHAIIREALQQAVKWQLVNRNVADTTEPPRARRAQVKTWDQDQVRRFLLLAKDDSFSPVWALALTTGMRRSELLGLRWQDVDLNRGTLHIQQCLVEVGCKLIFQEPKTSSSRRVVALPPSMVAILREHRIHQNEHRLRLGPVWDDRDLVFTTSVGSPIAPRNLIRRFKELIRKAELPEIPFHALRHTHATLLLRDGHHTKMVSERLGHASIAITLDTYSHVLPDMQREVADGVERLVFGT